MAISKLPECGWPLRDAIARVVREGSGVVVMLAKSEDSKALLQRMRSYQFQGMDVGSRPPPPQDNATELRQYGLGAQILLDLGIRRMRVMGAPRKLSGLSGFGLEITDYLSGEVLPD